MKQLLAQSERHALEDRESVQGALRGRHNALSCPTEWLTSGPVLNSTALGNGCGSSRANTVVSKSGHTRLHKKRGFERLE